MSHVELKGLGKTFGSFDAIRNISLSIEKGEFCALLGPLTATGIRFRAKAARARCAVVIDATNRGPRPS